MEKKKFVIKLGMYLLKLLAVALIGGLAVVIIIILGVEVNTLPSLDLTKIAVVYMLAGGIISEVVKIKVNGH